MDAGPAAAAAQAQAPSIAPFIITIIGLTLGIGLLIARMERKSVMAAWDERRCDPFVMFAGAYYKPESDPRTPGEFSSDNFQYCLKELQKTAIGKAMAAPMSLFKSQIDAANTVAAAQNNDKLGIANLLKGIVGQIVGDFYGRIKLFGQQFTRILQRFRMAYERIAAAVNSIAFMGLALMQGIFNAYNTVILVVIIILGIIAGVFIIFFFTLAPFIPLLLTTVSVLTAAGFGGAVGPLGDVFCFAGETQVAMADGGWRSVAELELGDAVAGGGVVEGIYEMDGSQTQMFQLGGVIVSGDHLVYNEGTGAYCPVKEHPASVIAAAACSRVYCPSVSNRSLLCRGSSAGAGAGAEAGIWFRDWEEIEEESEAGWHSLIAGMLQSATPAPNNRSTGFDCSYKVYIKNKGFVAINETDIGDDVLTYKDGTQEKCYTRIIGSVRQLGDMLEGVGMGAASWIYAGGSGSSWTHPCVGGGSSSRPTVLYNLITESGTLIIRRAHEYFVRDALEVGIGRIAETYEFTMSELRKTESRPPNR